MYVQSGLCPFYIRWWAEILGKSMSKILCSGLNGDEGMWAVLDDIFEVMARVVMNTVTIIAPGKVILYGQMFESQTVMNRFIKKCKEYDPSISDDYLVKSRLSKKIEYIGPLSVAVNELLYHTGSSEE